jgi:hypothetical protein
VVLTVLDAEHFCRRVGFGGNSAEVAHFAGRSTGSVVNEVLNVVPSLPGRPGFLGYNNWWEDRAPLIDLWMQRMIDARWVNRSGATPSPLVEKLALFWHGHFACGLEKVSNSHAMWEQNQLFRQRGMGDFEDLTRRVSFGGAMLKFLDNETNIKGAEQENFARELMELHTIGVGNFTEQDVISMARAWTGHNIVGWSNTYWDVNYRYYPEHHDTGQKTLFGKTRNWDAAATITELVKGSKKTATARFIARKLWMYFVNGNPTDAQVNEIANAFINGGMQVKPAMRALLMHPAFWAASSRRGIVRPPVEWQVDILRRMGIPAVDAELTWLGPKMGQRLFEPPNVSGWGTHGYWVSTATTWGKGRFVDYIGWNDRVKERFGWLELMNREEAINHICDQFGIGDPSAASRKAVGDWFDVTKANKKWTLKHNGFRIGAMLPEFQAG